MRSYLPTLVYAIDVYNESQLSDTPFGSSFVVGLDINKIASVFKTVSVTTPSGAVPGAIGVKNGNSVTPIYTFRPPKENESVWLYETDNLYRWLKKPGGGYAWTLYKSMAQRTIEGLPVFGSLDKDGVYQYVAKLIGAIAVEIRGESAQLARLRDPKSIPSDLIKYEAYQIGTTSDDSEPIDVQRSRLEIFPLTYNARGSVESVESYASSQGYIGRSLEIFELIRWPSIILTDCSYVFFTNTDAANRLQFSDYSDDIKVVYFVSGGNPGAGSVLTIMVNLVDHQFIFYDGVYANGAAAAAATPPDGSLVVITGGTPGVWIVISNNGASFPSDYSFSSGVPTEAVIVRDSNPNVTAANLAYAINLETANIFDFVVSGALFSPRKGDTYSNSGSVFEVLSDTIDSTGVGTIRTKRRSGASVASSGNLTRIRGHGEPSYSYSSYTIGNAVVQDNVANNTTNPPYQVWPHGFLTTAPVKYWPSPFVGILIANRDYSAARLTSTQKYDLIKKTIPTFANVLNYGQIVRVGNVPPYQPDSIPANNYLLPDYVEINETAVGSGLSERPIRVRQAFTLTGTISQGAGGLGITGIGTLFLTELQVGDVIILMEDLSTSLVVVSITDDLTAEVSGYKLDTTPAGAAIRTRINSYPVVNDGWNPS